MRATDNKLQPSAESQVQACEPDIHAGRLVVPVGTLREQLALKGAACVAQHRLHERVHDRQPVLGCKFDNEESNAR